MKIYKSNFFPKRANNWRQFFTAPHLQRGEHDPLLAAEQVLLHQVLHQVYLRPKLQDARSHHHVLEHGEQVVHGPAQPLRGAARSLELIQILLKKLCHTVKLLYLAPFQFCNRKQNSAIH